MDANSSMSACYSQESCETRLFTHHDLLDFGQRYALDYRFPDLSGSGSILQGQVEELKVRPGMQLVYSNVRVIAPYESSSLNPRPLNMIIVLQGQVRFRLGGESILLSEQMALTLSLEQGVQFDAFQSSEQNLKVLSLSLNHSALDELGIPLRSGNWWLTWKLPLHLYQGLLFFRKDMQLAKLYLEGMGLQLLSQGLTEEPSASCKTRLLPQERLRLEQIHELITTHPQKDYSLSELAQLAAMSPSSLRNKFKAYYGQTLFNFLKQQRLQMAHHYLMQGFSVQQAAHFTGYSHATNFTTAFRKHFGVAPSSLVR